MVANIFTKPLARVKFETFRNLLNVVWHRPHWGGVLRYSILRYQRPSNLLYNHLPYIAAHFSSHNLSLCHTHPKVVSHIHYIYQLLLLMYHSLLLLSSYIQYNSLCHTHPKVSFITLQCYPATCLKIHYKCSWMDCYQPPWKPTRSNSELDPSKPFLLIICLSLLFYVFIIFHIQTQCHIYSMTLP